MNWIAINGKKYYLIDREEKREDGDIVVNMAVGTAWYRPCPPKPARTPKAKKKSQKPIGPKKVIVYEGEKYYLLPEGAYTEEGDRWAHNGWETESHMGLLVCGGSRLHYRRNETQSVDGGEYFRVRTGKVRASDFVTSFSGSGKLVAPGFHIGTKPLSLEYIWRPAPKPCAYKAWREQATETELRFVDVLVCRIRRSSKCAGEYDRACLVSADVTLIDSLPNDVYQALKATL